MSTRSIVKVKHTVPWGVGSIFATALETHNWTEFLEEDLHEFLKKTIKMAGRLAEKKNRRMDSNMYSCWVSWKNP